MSLILSFISIFPLISSLSFPGGIDEKDLRNKKMVSITFDDGPQRKYTSAVLDILRDKKVPATFFIIGNRVYHHEDILRRMIVEGHSIGNHSYTHTAFPKLTSEGVFREVFLTEKALFLTTGFMPRYFRFPYGEEDTRIKNVFFGQIIGWNVDAYDWKAKNPSVLTKQILSQLKPGCIILLHDIKPDTVAALPDIIEGIRKEGYTLVSLDTLLPKKKPQGLLVYRSQYNQSPLKATVQAGVISTESLSHPIEPIIVTEISHW